MTFLVDTSVWIRHFSRSVDFDLTDVCRPDERLLCLPVYQEILQGIRHEASYRRIDSILRAGLFVEDPLTRAVFAEAADLYRLGRKQGFTVRSSTDCLIAACAIRNNVPVLHSDRDFTAIARISTLIAQNV